MNSTVRLNSWIAEHGSARDALNVALAKLDTSRNETAQLDAENQRLRAMLSEFEFSDCGYCPVCGRDSNWGHEHGCKLSKVLYSEEPQK